MRDIPNENTPENVQIIIDEAKRLTTLVNDVLDISKLPVSYTHLDVYKRQAIIISTEASTPNLELSMVKS